MKPANLTSFLSVLVCLLAPSFATAQPASLVTVLAFTDSTGGDGNTAEQLYNAVRAQIQLHREYSLNDVPAQTLDDLLLAVGCASLDSDCSTLVADIVQSEFLAWGELVANQERLGVRMVLWDLGAAEEVRSVTHLLDIESTTTLLEFDAVIGRSLLYGDDEELTVSSTPVGATVYVDGEERGVTPLVVSVPLGIYDVELVAEGHRSARSTAMVDLGGGRVQATLELQPVDRTREGNAAVGDLAPWILVGAGGAMVVTGAVFGAQSKSTQREFDSVVAEQVLDRERAEDLQSTGESQATLSNVFIGAGAALLVGGVVWQVVGGKDDQDAEPAPWARVGGYVGDGGGGLTLTLTR